MTHVDRNVLLY